MSRALFPDDDPAVTGFDALLGDRYRLIRPAGEGGMAVVWEARDDVLARTVAVKLLSGHYARDTAARERIRREAQAAAAIAHPNIAQVHDYGEAGRVPYVVMEFIPGETLLQRMSRGPLPPEFAMRVGAEVAAALAAAHAAGLVHRDIKPANVMMAPTGAKVVDFGIAAAIAPAGLGTDDDMVYGTPAYLAPERLLGDAVEPASDVYALGVLLHLLLAGRSPWTIEDTTEMLSAHIYLEPPPLPELPGVPAYVIDLGNRCLLKDPVMRPSAREAAALLARGAGLRIVTDEDQNQIGSPPAADDAPSVLVRSAPEPEPEPAPPGRRPSKRLIAIGAAALVLAAAGVVGWQLLPGEPTSALTVSPPVPAASPAGSPAGPAARGTTSTTPATTQTAGRGTAGPATNSPAAPPAPVPTSIGPTATGPATTDPAVTDPAQPQERTFTSGGGTVTATCPAASTAQILSATATKPYKIASRDDDPGPAPSVVFKRGNALITMTVTCASGVPAVAVS